MKYLTPLEMLQVLFSGGYVFDGPDTHDLYLRGALEFRLRSPDQKSRPS